jgi:DNA-binding CsgD family transcriptional regulator
MMLRGFLDDPPDPADTAPERSDTRWFLRLLDEIDYGLAVIDVQGGLQYANHRARPAMDESGPLQCQGDRLQPRRRGDAGAWLAALAAAAQGRRSLLCLGEPPARLSMAVVPLSVPGEPAAETRIALVFQKRHTLEPLTLGFYARAHQLTSAETAVLEALCQGLRPQEIAERHGVALSTVRTQVGSIRAKTHTGSMRELVHQLATLPPLTPVVKGLTAH